MAAKRVVPKKLSLYEGRLEGEVARLAAERDDLQRQVGPLREDYKAANKKVEELEAKLAKIEATSRRRRLPDERLGDIKKLRIPWTDASGKSKPLKIWLTVGLFSDGTLGEIFLRGEKLGSFESGLLDAFAIAISLGLQYGVPVEHLVQKLRGMRFEPEGFTGDKEYPNVSSIVDYVARYLEKKFVKKVEE